MIARKQETPPETTSTSSTTAATRSLPDLPHEAPSPGLQGSADEVVRALVLGQWKECLRTVELISSREDPEDVHRMRVGVRRLRALLKLFRSLLPRQVKGPRTDLRRVGRAAGAVRDLDVLLDRLPEAAQDLALNSRHSFVLLEQILRKQRDRFHRRLRRVLESPSFLRLKLRIPRVMAQGPVSDAPRRKRPLDAAGSFVAEGSQVLLAQVQRVLRRSRKCLRIQDPERLHRLRIEVKTLRYCLDVLSPSVGQPAQKALRSLVELQTILGEVQDDVVAVDQVRTLSQHRSGRDLSSARGVTDLLVKRWKKRLKKLHRKLPKKLRKLDGRRWRVLLSRLRVLRTSTESAASAHG